MTTPADDTPPKKRRFVFSRRQFRTWDAYVEYVGTRFNFRLGFSQLALWSDHTPLFNFLNMPKPVEPYDPLAR